MSSSTVEGNPAAQGESSGGTVEIRIRTLDSASHTIRVKKDIPIPALKEQLQPLVGVPAADQRLICRGRVLKDDQLLSAYNVEDGHTLHLVARPQSQPGESQGVQPNAQGQTDSTQQGRPAQVTHSLLVGTINVPTIGDGGLPDFNRIVSAVLGSVGNLQGPNAPGAGAAPAEAQQGAQAAPQRAATVGMGNNQFLPRNFEVSSDALTTLSLYLNRLEQMFANSGFGSASQQPSAPASAEGATAGTRQPTWNRPLMTPTALAGIIRRVQSLLTAQAAVIFSGLSGQLENEASLTDVNMRGEVQAAAVWTGTVMQQLGALLMELGRTTLTLHMGATTAEAIVNSGPAVFISPSGPNPIMVQPMPFQPLGTMSPRTPLHPTGWPGVPGPRSLNIHIHTSDVGITPTTNVPPSAPSTATGTLQEQQQQGQQQQETPPSSTAAPQSTGQESNGEGMPGAVVQETIMVIQDNGDARVLSSRSRNVNPGTPTATATEGTVAANSNVPMQAGPTAQMAQVAQAFNQLWPGLPNFRGMQQPHTGPLTSMNMDSSTLSSILGGQLPAAMQNQLQGQQNFVFPMPLQSMPQAQVPSPQTTNVVSQPSANDSITMSELPTLPIQAHQSAASLPSADSSPGTSDSQIDTDKRHDQKEKLSTSAQANPPVGLGLAPLRPLVPRRRTDGRPQGNQPDPSARVENISRRLGATAQRPSGQLAGDMTNIMGQIMRSPAMETLMQNMGETPSTESNMQNLDLGRVFNQAFPMVSQLLASGGNQVAQNTPSGDGSGQSLDFGRVLNEALPMVSQLLASGGNGRLHQNSAASSDSSPQTNTEVPRAVVENGVHENVSTKPEESALSKLEGGDSTEDVMSSVAQAALQNAAISLSDNELSELLHADGLSEEYISMLLQDLNSRRGS